MLGALIDAGMNVARFNFSHGAPSEHEKTLNILREESAKRQKPVAALLDLQGPKIRVDSFKGGSAELKAGEQFKIVTQKKIEGDKNAASTNYSGITKDVSKGDRILLDDGYLSLTVVEIRENEVITEVEQGGTLKNRKGINLPNATVSQPALTPQDKEHLAFGLKLGFDYIALSFVQTPEDVLEAKALATAGGVSIPVIAKIEKPQALEHLDAIIDAADGIMVARGDLGVELGPEKVPLVQKDIIRRTNSKGKPVITATHMLESMIENARPTRAEASDVANAILDGTDAVMLSGETAVGVHPTRVVQTMSNIIEEIESSSAFRIGVENEKLDIPVQTNAIAHGAVSAAKQLDAPAITVMSESGGTARLISEYRPDALIVSLTTNPVTYRRLALHWGVQAHLVDPCVTFDEVLEHMVDIVGERDVVKSGQSFIATAAIPVGSGESANVIKIHRVP